MKDVKLTHFYSWRSVPDPLVPAVMTEFADNGATDLVLSDAWGERLVREPGLGARLAEAAGREVRNYSWEALTGRLLTLYRELIHARI